MVNLLQRASDWLEAMRTKHASHSVTYQRGDAVAVVSATIGKTVFTVDEGGDIATQFVSRDFLILTAELVLTGQAVLPQRGDRIQEMQGEQTFVYEVLAPGKEPCFRYSDPYRKTLRIHTKQVF
jgi:hypothetical protein